MNDTLVIGIGCAFWLGEASALFAQEDALFVSPKSGATPFLCRWIEEDLLGQYVGNAETDAAHTGIAGAILHPTPNSDAQNADAALSSRALLVRNRQGNIELRDLTGRVVPLVIVWQPTPEGIKRTIVPADSGGRDDLPVGLR